ncbi:hypothetical protein [Frankia gtarii]|uniref:hypothetical protein n=1 Tax=Frankia gtarii TaxID=2950102 RepID=UPI0021BFF124|nr:hypothetical protein [Frankia gtarii]
MFRAVLAWSRIRFVRFAADERAAPTMGMLAASFDMLGEMSGVSGVPGVSEVEPADRMGSLNGGAVAGRVSPHPSTCGSPQIIELFQSRFS